MYKATTPTITFNFPDSVDMTQAQNVYVTFSTKGGKTLVTKEGSALQIEAQTVAVTFTQAETLDLPAGTICAQINWLYTEESQVKRACSAIVEITVKDNLLNEVKEA